MIPSVPLAILVLVLEVIFVVVFLAIAHLEYSLARHGVKADEALGDEMFKALKARAFKRCLLAVGLALCYAAYGISYPIWMLVGPNWPAFVVAIAALAGMVVFAVLLRFTKTVAYGSSTDGKTTTYYLFADR